MCRHPVLGCVRWLPFVAVLGCGLVASLQTPLAGAETEPATKPASAAAAAAGETLYLADWNTEARKFVEHGADNPHPIPTDYSADVQPHLQAAIGGVQNGDTLVFPKIAWDFAKVGYKVESPLRLRGHNLTFVGNGTVIRRFTPGKDDKSDRTRSNWDILKCNGISFEHLAVYGAGGKAHGYDAAREAQHAFSIISSSNVTIKDCTIHNTFGDGVCVASFPAKDLSKNIAILHNDIEGTGRDGIALVGGEFIVVDGNTFKHNRHMMDIEPETNSAHVDYVRITNNTFGDTKKGSFDCNGAGRTGIVYMANNTLADANSEVVWDNAGGKGKKGNGRTSGPFIYLNNTAVCDAKAGRHAANTIWNEIAVLFAGNSVKFTGRGATGVRVCASDNVLVGNNHMNGAGSAVSIAGSKNTQEWDNAAGGADWKSPVTVAEIADHPNCYAASMPYKDGGHVYAIWRLDDGKDQLTFHGLTTSGVYAVAIVNADGDLITGHSLKGDGSYKDKPLK